MTVLRVLINRIYASLIPNNDEPLVTNNSIKLIIIFVYLR